MLNPETFTEILGKRLLRKDFLKEVGGEKMTLTSKKIEQLKRQPIIETVIKKE